MCITADSVACPVLQHHIFPSFKALLSKPIPQLHTQHRPSGAGVFALNHEVPLFAHLNTHRDHEVPGPCALPLNAGVFAL
eukprot:1138848-Pelagomonas_calceolata.AAC.14